MQTTFDDASDPKKELTTHKIFSPIQFFLKFFGLIASEPRSFESDGELEPYEESTDEDEKGTHFAGLFSGLLKLQEKYVKTCELVSIANKFWSSYMFYAFITFLPFSVFALYQIILGKHALFLDFNFVWYGGLGFLTLCFMALAASNVNIEAHKPITVVHDLSLNENLTIDQQVQIRYFIQRITGNTIGFSCLGLFTISQSKIYSIITVVISYVFLIIDMNKGSVAPKTCPTFTNDSILALFKPEEDEVLLDVIEAGEELDLTSM
ncbi:Gustatory receptor-like protein [Leptotrombidium deliense]|uniref:Gustatory receptor-like protein n=1 Tax=Leptotrombidium deliense TaxID=299467 RepID=A0A443SUF1_9ACAR|nr:Gustatory receptor-like protein [Leptotrombidium deliense]